MTDKKNGGPMRMVAWGLGALFIFLGLGSFLMGLVAGGIMFTIAGLITLPNEYEFIEKKLNFKLSKWVRVGIVFVLVIVGNAMVFPSLPNATAEQQNRYAYSTPEATVQVTYFAPGDRITFKENVFLTLLDVSKEQGFEEFGTNRLNTASNGAVFVLFSAKFENDGMKQESIHPEFEVKDEQGRSYGVDGGGHDDSGRSYDYDLNPGLTRTRLNYFVEVPETVKTLFVTVKTSSFLGSTVGTYKLDLANLNN